MLHHTARPIASRLASRPRRSSGRIIGSVTTFVLHTLNGTHHPQALALYLLVVAGHFSEHLIQLYQVFALGWARPQAGGLLGLQFPALAANEVLHMSYNSLQLTGLLLLLPGFLAAGGAARRWWAVAIAFQGWHWLEHAFLQVQVLTGHYFYGAIKQMSVLERFFPRVELHFAYNLLVLVPTLIAVVLYVRQRARQRGAATSPAGVTR